MTKLKISHSEINVWNRCSFKHYIHYQQGWRPKVDKKYFVQGKFIHDILSIRETCWKEGITDHKYIEELIKKKIHSSIPEGIDIEVVDLGGRLALRYLDYYEDDLKNWEILDVEREIEVEFESPHKRQYRLVGYADLLIRDRNTGRNWLVERKTHNGPQNSWGDIAVMMDNQTPTYLTALRSEGIEVFGILFDQINTYNYKNWKDTPPDKLFQRKSTYRTDSELVHMYNELGKAVDEREENKDAPRRNLVPKDCERCIFQDPCLLNMKGVSLEEALESNFYNINDENKGETIDSSEKSFTDLRII